MHIHMHMHMHIHMHMKIIYIYIYMFIYIYISDVPVARLAGSNGERRGRGRPDWVSAYVHLSLSLSPPHAASIAQLVEPRSWIRKALSSILASATTEWATKKCSPQSLRRNLKPEIPQVFQTSAAPVQE